MVLLVPCYKESMLIGLQTRVCTSSAAAGLSPDEFSEFVVNLMNIW